MPIKLPPGQHETEKFPRFGLSQYADRFPEVLDKIEIIIAGDGFDDLILNEELIDLHRVEQISDFHCVTTWSKTGLHWSGLRFIDFYENLIEPKLKEGIKITHVIFKAQDGYKTSLLLEDLLHESVMLVDKLNGEKLNIEHGAPIRLIAPAHYGYKNLKHLKRIEFYSYEKKVKQGFLSFMDHPRARVAKEERAVGGPGWFFRYLYRPLIKGTVRQFDKAMSKYYDGL